MFTNGMFTPQYMPTYVPVAPQQPFIAESMPNFNYIPVPRPIMQPTINYFKPYTYMEPPQASIAMPYQEPVVVPQVPQIPQIKFKFVRNDDRSNYVTLPQIQYESKSSNVNIPIVVESVHQSTKKTQTSRPESSGSRFSSMSSYEIRPSQTTKRLKDTGTQANIQRKKLVNSKPFLVENGNQTHYTRVTPVIIEQQVPLVDEYVEKRRRQANKRILLPVLLRTKKIPVILDNNFGSKRNPF